MRNVGKVTRRFVSFALAMFIMVTTVFGNVDLVAWADEVKTETVAAFSYTVSNAPAVSEDGLNVEATSGKGNIYVDATYTGFASGGLTAKQWKKEEEKEEEKAWTIVFDATGYDHLVIKGKMRSTSTAPLTWNVKYSVDGGTTWSKSVQTITATSSLVDQLNASLDDYKGTGVVKVRVEVAKDSTAVNGKAIEAGGNVNINNIVVTGQKIATASDATTGGTSTEDTTSASGIENLTVSESHTGDLAVGSELTLKCGDLTDLTYEVKVDDGEYTVLSGNTYTIPESVAGNHTFTFRAKKDDTYSKELTVKVTVASTIPTTYTQTASQVTELTDGSYVYIYSVVNSCALTSVASGSKLKGSATATVADGKLTVTDEMQLVKVVKDDEGYYSFVTFDGKYLTSGATGNSLTFASTASDYSLWTVSSAKVGDDTGFVILNKNASYTKKGTTYSQALEYYGGFTSYNYDQVNLTNIYLFRFYTPDANDKLIAEVKEVTDGTTVKTRGVITYVSGKDAYIQDATGAIALRADANIADLSVGDLVEVAGTKGSYKGNLQISKYTATVLAKKQSYKVTALTIQEFATSNNVYCYMPVTVSEGILGEINAGGSTDVTDANGNKTILYQASAIKDCNKGDTISFSATAYSFNGTLEFTNVSNVKVTKSASGTTEETTEETSTEEALQLPDSGSYVIWAPKYNEALCSEKNSSGYYIGGDVAGTKDAVSGYKNTSLWTLTKSEDGKTYTISQDGVYVGLTSAGKLTIAAAPAVKDWTIEIVDGYYRIYGEIPSTTTTGSATKYYLEWASTYSDWNVYKTITDDTASAFNFYITAAARVYDYDSDLSVTYATWGGGSQYADGATSISGDLFDAGDMKDTSVEYSAVISGKEVQAYTAGTANYYMGGTGIGSGTNDYLQFKLSTKGYAGSTMSFRLRGSKTSAAEYTLQYSVDGKTFYSLTTGSYDTSYTAYTSDGSSIVTKNGEITNGKAQASLAATYYINFTFDLPSGADNADKLYVRLVPSSTRANGNTGTIDSGATVRIDSVKFTGSPIVDDSIVSYVNVDPDGIDEDQAPGTEIGMESSTTGATISYRFVTTDNYADVAWQTYTGSESCKLPATLPVYLQVKATKEGMQDSIVRTLLYAAGSVSTVKMTPNGGGVYIADANGSTTVTLSCETEGATIYYNTGKTADDGTFVYEVYDPENTKITLEKGFASYVVRAYAVKEGFKDSAVTTRTFTERSQESYNIYFGQMHSHTSYSDGSGTAEDAFSHASNVENLDFLAVTDHSNSLDGADSSALGSDAAKYSTEWAEGKTLAEKYTTEKFVGLFGFEMTWSNGLGHINTFNTPGFQSRTQSEYGTYATALQNYYATLKTESDSISQFNHPGTTFGDFSDFAYYDDEIDQLITLIEVGNGEGEIGSSNYFPSYEYYTRALDKGWHVAPTNNQDNHKGLWGDANTARSVVLADTLSEESIYDAMRNYRVYATEDNDLSIYYTLDGNIMGTILSKSDVDDTVTLKASISDPTDKKIGKVEVIVNGGLSIASLDVDSNTEDITFTVTSDYSYYYLRVTEEDGDIAVTAPVWVGDVEAVGINSFSTSTVLPVQGEAVTLNTTVYNNEKKPLLINKIEYSILDSNDEKQVIKTIEGDELTTLGMNKVAKQKEASCSIDYTYSGLGKTSYYVTVYGTLNNVEKVYTEKLELNYVSKEMVTNVVVDGSHYNDYVTGYYGGNMGNFAALAADKSIKVTIAGGDKDASDRSLTKDEWTELLSDASLLIVSAPARSSGTANAGEYKASSYEDWFIALVKDFVDDGGSVIVAGLADYQDTKADSADNHAAAQQNKLLAALGSSMKINDDEAYDLTNNGGQAYRLYAENFDMTSKWLNDVVDKATNSSNYQKYSAYSGCTVDAGNGTALVSGFATTCSVDSDNDGVGNNGNTLTVPATDSTSAKTYKKVVDEGKVTLLAAEDTGKGGTIFVSGSVFVSDFEVEAEKDNAYDLPYANATIAENILDAVKVELPYTSIAEVRKAANEGKNGSVYRIKGRVTSGTANEDNAFFDCIYVQDDTAGIDIFPYAEAGLELGTEIEITGYIDSYQGDLELKVMSYKILDAENLASVDPTLLTCKEASDYATNGGLLTKVEGTVKKDSLYYNSDGTLAQFVVTDKTGDTTIFIDGYILSGTTGKNTLADEIKAGYTVSAVGVQYMHPELYEESTKGEEVSVLRVRNCDEIVVTAKPAATVTPATSSNPVVNVITNTVNRITNALAKIGNGIGNFVRKIAKKVTTQQAAAAANNTAEEKTETITDNSTPTSAQTEEIETEAAPLAEAAVEAEHHSPAVPIVFACVAVALVAAGFVLKKRSTKEVK